MPLPPEIEKAITRFPEGAVIQSDLRYVARLVAEDCASISSPSMRHMKNFCACAKRVRQRYGLDKPTDEPMWPEKHPNGAQVFTESMSAEDFRRQYQNEPLDEPCDVGQQSATDEGCRGMLDTQRERNVKTPAEEPCDKCGGERKVPCPAHGPDCDGEWPCPVCGAGSKSMHQPGRVPCPKCGGKEGE